MSNEAANIEQQLTKLKSNQKATSAKFKEIQKNSTAHFELLGSMKEISTEIRRLEQILAATKDNPQPNTPTAPTVNPFPTINAKYVFQKAYSIRLLNTGELYLWNNFLAKIPHTPYSHKDWFEVIKSSFGHDTTVLIALDEDQQIIGGLPLTIFSSRIFGRFAVSVPYINYGGVVSKYWNIAQAIIESSRELLHKLHLSHIEIRSLQRDFDAPYLDRKASLILPLPDSMEELDSQWNAKLRSQCKKAEKFSPTLKVGKLELLNDFYRVFSRNMRDLGTPVYSKNFFKNILKSSLTSFILIVRINGKPVSCGFFIGNNEILEIPWASTIESANIYSANMYFYREALRIAIEKRFKFFDFGRSTIGAGTYKFKRQWGAEAIQHYWYYILPSGRQLPNLNPENPKYKLFINMWKLLPVWLSQLVGPFVIRNVP